MSIEKNFEKEKNRNLKKKKIFLFGRPLPLIEENKLSGLVLQPYIRIPKTVLFNTLILYAIAFFHLGQKNCFICFSFVLLIIFFNSQCSFEL